MSSNSKYSEEFSLDDTDSLGGFYDDALSDILDSDLLSNDEVDDE